MLLCGQEATSRLEVSLLCSQEGLSRGPLGGKRPARGRPRLGEECGRALGDLPRLPAHAPTPPTSLTSQGRGTPGRTGHALWLEGPLRARKGLPLRHREVWVGRRTRLCPAWGVGNGRAGSPTQPGAQLLGKGQAGPSSLKPIPSAGVSADQGTPRTSPQWPRSPAACSHPPSTGLCEDGYLVLLASTRQFITGH